MIDAAARPMVSLDEVRDRRQATLVVWRCEGVLADGSGRPCRKFIIELDPDRPSFLRSICKRCGHTNIYVEAYRPASPP